MDDESGSVPADSLIRYDLMVQESLRQVIKDALILAAEEGLPGEHHFYITFSTTYPGVEIPDKLLDQYPEEMTIVLQHQFWQLSVDEDSFSVTLSFSGVPQTLLVPYKAVSAFADPHVRFGLQFHLDEEMERSEGEPAAAPSGEPEESAVGEADHEGGPAEASTKPKDGDGESNTVVSLDTFRRKR